MRGHRAFSLLLTMLLLLIAAVAASQAGARPDDRSATSATGALAGQCTPTWASLPASPCQETGAKLAFSRSTVSTAAKAVTRAGGKPQITKLSPSEGKPSTKVTIKGKSFGAKRGHSYVKFGKLRCTRYVLWSRTKIICRVPANAAGTLGVQVKTSAGLSNRKSFLVTGAPVPSPTPLPGTFFQETDTHMRFLGAWTSVSDAGCSGGTQKTVNAPGAVFVDFTGTQAHLVASTGPAYGIMKVTLDGAAQPNVDLYAAAAKYQQTVFSKAGLTDGAHRLVIEWTFSKNAAASATTINLDAVNILGTLTQAPDLTDGLVGFWAATPDGSWVESYTFRADGTYTYLLQSLIGSTSGLLRQEGLYAAYQGQSSMLLFLFDRWERFTPSGGPDGAWYSVASGEWPYQITYYSNATKLNIANGWTADYWLQ